MLRGEEALDALARAAPTVDSGSSSYWQQHHRSLHIVEGEFAGGDQFGTFHRRRPGPLGWSVSALHTAMQRPHRSAARRCDRFPEADRRAREIVARQGRVYDHDALRQAATAAVIGDRDLSLPVVIGDGYGLLSMTLLALGAPVVVDVNLTQTLFADLWFAHRAGGTIALAATADDVAAAPRGTLVGVRADDHGLLADLPVTVAANVASMQEMDPPVIASYFDVLRSTGSTWFYCCNRVEKQLPDGTITRFRDYPWRSDDEVAFDEPCPWQLDTYSIRPPRRLAYAGPVWHRLARLASG